MTSYCLGSQSNTRPSYLKAYLSLVPIAVADGFSGGALDGASKGATVCSTVAVGATVASERGTGADGLPGRTRDGTTVNNPVVDEFRTGCLMAPLLLAGWVLSPKGYLAERPMGPLFI